MDIDKVLNREIVTHSSFGSLIDSSSCQISYLGEGDTFLSIDLIAKQAKKHKKQSERWAKKLKQQTLSQTISANYRFLYEHFQYKADGAKQNLYSPKCAWKMRFKGIDCKSYSLIASTLLLNQGISHYIRKIKQPSYLPEEFTHVYVIIPKNQNTNTLNDGYYVIDATTHNNIEPTFVEKYDVFMKHYGLNGKVSGCTTTQAKKRVKLHSAGRNLPKGSSRAGKTLAKHRWGLNACCQNTMESVVQSKPHLLDAGFSKKISDGIEEYTYILLAKGVPSNQLKYRLQPEGLEIYAENGEGMLFVHPNAGNGQWIREYLTGKQGLNSSQDSTGLDIDGLFEDINFDDLLDNIGSFFGGIFGIGSSGFYKNTHIEENTKKLTQYLVDQAIKLNEGIVGNDNMFRSAILELKNVPTLIEQAFLRKRSEGWSGHSEKNLQASAKYAKNLGESITNTLNAYLSQYFIKQSASTININFNSKDYSKNGNSGANKSDMFGLHLGNPIVINASSNVTYAPKPNMDIPAYLITEDMVQKARSGIKVNTGTWLNSLTDKLLEVISPGQPNTGGGSVVPINPGTTIGTSNGQNVTTASFGGNTFLTVGLVSAGLYMLYKNHQKQTKSA